MLLRTAEDLCTSVCVAISVQLELSDNETEPYVAGPWELGKWEDRHMRTFSPMKLTMRPMLEHGDEEPRNRISVSGDSEPMQIGLSRDSPRAEKSSGPQTCAESILLAEFCSWIADRPRHFVLLKYELL